MSDSRATAMLAPRLLWALALLLTTVGIAIMRAHFEHFSGPALIIVIAAAAIAGVALLGMRSVDAEKSNRLILPLVVVALIVAFSQLPMLDLVWRNWRVAKDAPFYFVSVSLWAILVVAILVVPGRRLRTLLFAVLLLSHVAVGWWFLSSKPGDACDVYVIQKLGAEALLHGQNPFAITFPDIYGPNAHFYPPGIVLEHVVQMPGGPGIARDVQCGYFYLPMSLLLAIPGYLLGDVRYSNLVALEIAGALIAFARPTRVSFFCAMVVVFCPGIFLMLSNAWIEPQMLMLLALALFLAVRGHQTWALVVLGLVLAEKQYMILALPVFPLIMPERGIRSWLRAVVIVGLTAAVVILPFFYWDPRAFLHSATALYVNLLRTDAISIPAWLKLRFDIQLDLLVTAGVGAAAAIVTAIRGRRDPASFAAGVAFVLAISFLFSTQAFLNYYFLAAGGLALAVSSENHVDVRSHINSIE